MGQSSKGLSIGRTRKEGDGKPPPSPRGTKAMPPAKTDKGTANWMDPNFVVHAAVEMGLAKEETDGLRRLWVFLLDGTGLRKSETEGHHDVTISGVIPCRGGHLDKSIYSMIVDMIATSKDSKLIWDAHFLDWAKRWAETLPEEDISIAL